MLQQDRNESNDAEINGCDRKCNREMKEHTEYRRIPATGSCRIASQKSGRNTLPEPLERQSTVKSKEERGVKKIQYANSETTIDDRFKSARPGVHLHRSRIKTSFAIRSVPKRRHGTRDDVSHTDRERESIPNGWARHNLCGC